MKSRNAFTLIELLIVIAIIAILAVVVVLTLNPAELLKQARDTSRLSDLSTVTHAINIYSALQTGGYLGIPGTTYVSLLDPTATTTAGTDCSSLGFPAGGAYHCAASSSYRRVDGTGWIPINLASTSGGTPLAVWPIDPVNSSSSGFYYQYETDGSRFELAATVESQKQIAKGSLSINGSSKSLIAITCKTFAMTGSVASWTVPAGVSSITITALGAGGGGTGSSAGGAGGSAVGTLAVVPGTTYYVNVGGRGFGVPGYSGGGTGDYGGGGMTWFSSVNSFATSSVILVAAGGAGGDPSGAIGGAGGGLTGGNGAGGNCNGRGGTQSAGGSGGGTGATAGSAGQGGTANTSGGGGGGYFGGGGGYDDGFFCGAAGGGGSSYLSPLLTTASTVAGGGAAAQANGSLSISCS